MPKGKPGIPVRSQTFDELKEDLAKLNLANGAPPGAPVNVVSLNSMTPKEIEELTEGVSPVNAPPPGTPDPMKLSRMIRLLTDYVQEGLIQKPERPFKTMTEGELENLIEGARANREAQENPEPEPNAEPEPEEEAPAEPAVAPRPGPQQPEPQPEGAPVSPEGITEKDFKDRYPVGQHIDYGGEEYIVSGHSKVGAEGLPKFDAIKVGEVEEFDTDEHDEGSIEIHPSPTKIPQKTEYPPQVFLLATVQEGNAVAEIFLDHKKLATEHPEIDADAIMEAISDPGEPQGVTAGTLVYASVG